MQKHFIIFMVRGMETSLRTILADGEEISNYVMAHSPNDTTPFNIDIPWSPELAKVDYFDIIFKYFFPSLAKKAAVINKYLSNPRCPGHESNWVKEKVRFHQEDNANPDYIVSS